MTVDRAFIESNRAATARIRAFEQVSDEALRTRLGEHWTVAMMLVHLAFWDRRALFVLEMTEQAGKLVAPQFDNSLNDMELPFWAAIPVRDAVRLAVEAAEALDAKLANYPPELLEVVDTFNPRWVSRAAHRNLHIDEAEVALK